MKTILLLFLLTFALNAEEIMIHGNVYGLDNEGEPTPLPGVRVQWLGTDKGGLSNEAGHFMFYTSGDSRHLIFEMLGYKTDTLHVEDLTKFINHYMKPVQTKEAIVERQKPNKIYDSSIEAKETITRQALSKIACCNLSEAFETDPNVSLQYTDPVSGAKRIRMMGLDGKYSQVMIEKQPFLRGLNIPYGLSFLPGPWVESISISKGTADVTNGFENFTGQINVELKKPFEDATLINTFVDAGQRTEINAIENISLSDDIKSIVMLHGSVITKFTDMNNSGFADRPITRSFNLMNKYQYKEKNGNSAAQIGFRALYDEKESRLNRQLPFSFDINNSRFELFFKNGYDYDVHNMGFSGSVAFQNNNTLNNFIDYGNQYNINHTTANLNANFIYGFGENTSSSKTILTYGSSFLYDNFTNEFVASTDDKIQPTMEFVTPGVFANMQYSKIENIDFSFGLRADYNQLNNVFFTPRAMTKIKFSERLDVRINVGKGFRYNNAFSENIYLFFYALPEDYVAELVNFRQNKMEEAWNYGINANWNFDLFDKNITINGEYYKTDFINRVIVDQYRYSEEYRPQIYETSETSFSESFGLDIDIPLTDEIALTSSIRFDNSYFTNLEGNLLREPLTSVYKSLTNLYIELPWDLSLRSSASFHGWGKRTLKENGQFRNFDSFWLFSGQINKKIESINLEIYIGADNITSYTILQGNTDWQAIGANYIGTDLWGPLMGRNFYLGINWNGL